LVGGEDVPAGGQEFRAQRLADATGGTGDQHGGIIGAGRHEL
jgi:hypothetical protein